MHSVNSATVHFHSTYCIQYNLLVYLSCVNCIENSGMWKWGQDFVALETFSCAKITANRGHFLAAPFAPDSILYYFRSD